MCQITSDVENKIQEIVKQNRKQIRKVADNLTINNNNDQPKDNLDLQDTLNSVFEQSVDM